jgi:hypothetical protein
VWEATTFVERRGGNTGGADTVADTDAGNSADYVDADADSARSSGLLDGCRCMHGYGST